jgi:hypothetical protein
MKLVWLSSGDEIEIVPANQELCEYYIHAIAPYNRFVCMESSIDHAKIDYLKWALEDINAFLTRYKIAPAFVVGNAFDQNWLNELHRAWVKFHLATPKIIQLLRAKEPDLINRFRGINKTLHGIEQMFVQVWANIDNGEVHKVPNPFVNALGHDMANVQVVFNDLGRNTFNKWLYFDNNLDPDDTNDYNNMPVEIEINLNRPINYTAPSAYVDWCKQQGLDTPPGRWLNLGNIRDLEFRLEDYRNILMRNRSVDMHIAM